MKTILFAAALLAVGCGGKKDHGKAGATGSAGEPVPPPALPAGAADDAGMEGSAALHLPTTPAERGKLFEDCWALWNAGRFDAFGNCYALDAKVEAPGSGQPAAASRAAIVEQVKTEHAMIRDQQGALGLELVSGQTVIAIAQITGTVNGSPTGVLAGVVSELDGKGMITHEETFLDAATIAGQVSGGSGVRPVPAAAPAHEVVVAKNDDTEKANLEVFRKFADAFDKHDVAAYSALLADDVVWSETLEPRDDDRKALIANVTAFWKQMPDAQLDVKRTWAAGPYVAAEESLVGQLQGNRVEVPALVIHQLAGGKLVHGWLFAQSAAFRAGAGAGSGSAR